MANYLSLFRILLLTVRLSYTFPICAREAQVVNKRLKKPRINVFFMVWLSYLGIHALNIGKYSYSADGGLAPMFGNVRNRAVNCFSFNDQQGHVGVIGHFLDSAFVKKVFKKWLFL